MSKHFFNQRKPYHRKQPWGKLPSVSNPQGDANQITVSFTLYYKDGHYQHKRPKEETIKSARQINWKPVQSQWKRISKRY